MAYLATSAFSTDKTDLSHLSVSIIKPNHRKVKHWVNVYVIAIPKRPDSSTTCPKLFVCLASDALRGQHLGSKNGLFSIATPHIHHILDMAAWRVQGASQGVLGVYGFYVMALFLRLYIERVPSRTTHRRGRCRPVVVSPPSCVVSSSVVAVSAVSLTLMPPSPPPWLNLPTEEYIHSSIKHTYTHKHTRICTAHMRGILYNTHTTHTFVQHLDQYLFTCDCVGNARCRQHQKQPIENTQHQTENEKIHPNSHPRAFAFAKVCDALARSFQFPSFRKCVCVRMLKVYNDSVFVCWYTLRNHPHVGVVLLTA